MFMWGTLDSELGCLVFILSKMLNLVKPLTSTLAQPTDQIVEMEIVETDLNDMFKSLKKS